VPIQTHQCGLFILIAWSKPSKNHFQDNIFLKGLDVGDSAYLFLFATQRSQQAHFLRLTVDEPLLPCLEGLDWEQIQEGGSDWFSLTFTCQTGDFVKDNQFDLPLDQARVIIDGFFKQAGRVVAVAEPVDLSAVLESLPVAGPARQSGTGSGGHQVMTPALLQEHPWLQQFVPPEATKPQSGGARAPAPAEAAKPPAEPVGARCQP